MPVLGPGVTQVPGGFYYCKLVDRPVGQFDTNNGLTAVPVQDLQCFFVPGPGLETAEQHPVPRDQLPSPTAPVLMNSVPHALEIVEGLLLTERESQETSYLEGVVASEIDLTAERWQDLDGALNDDGAQSIVTLTTGAYSSKLVVQKFNIRLPEDAIILGIGVEIIRAGFGDPALLTEDSVHVFTCGFRTNAKIILAGGNYGNWNAVPVGTEDTITVKYLLADDSSAVGVNLNAKRSRPGAVGNFDLGLWLGSFSTTDSRASIDKYRYADSVTELSPARFDVVPLSPGAISGQSPLAFGVESHALIIGGGNSEFTRQTALYFYANDTLVSDGLRGGSVDPDALGFVSQSGVAGCNTMFGYVADRGAGTAFFNPSSISQRYSFAAAAWQTGTALAISKFSMAAAASPTELVVGHGELEAGGTTSTTERYNFAAGSVIAGGALYYAAYKSAAGGDDTRAVFVGGQTTVNNATNLTSKYLFATNTASASTALALIGDNAGALSSSPGGLS